MKNKWGIVPINEEEWGIAAMNKEEWEIAPLNKEKWGTVPMNKEEQGTTPQNKEEWGTVPMNKEKCGTVPVNKVHWASVRLGKTMSKCSASLLSTHYNKRTGEGENTWNEDWSRTTLPAIGANNFRLKVNILTSWLLVPTPLGWRKTVSHSNWSRVPDSPGWLHTPASTRQYRITNWPLLWVEGEHCNKLTNH